MASRGIAGLLTLALLVGVASAQVSPSPYTNLLIAARGSTPDQSLLYEVDTRTGLVRTLFDEHLGTFTDLTMDRDNAGLVAVFQGSKGTGVYRLGRSASSFTMREACAIRNPAAALCCLEMSGEDLWIAGTALAEGVGRVGEFEMTPASLTESETFPGFEISEILVDRNNARMILGLNSQSGSAVCHYDPAGASPASTLASFRGFITDLVQDPSSGGVLVSTNDPDAPVQFLDTINGPPRISFFSFPVSVYPGGLPVDAIALDARMNAGGTHRVWALSGNRLFALVWDSIKSTLVFPQPLLHYTMPFQHATAMIFDGGRDFLMTSSVGLSEEPTKNAWLHVRLGPAHAGQPYLIAASLGNHPPIPLPDKRWINLRPDPLFYLSVTGQLPAQVFEEFSGSTTLDGEVTGKVTTRETWGRSMTGVTLYFAGVILDAGVPGRIRTVTNSVALTLF